MLEWLAAVLLLASAAFMLLAAIGILRLPDLFTRMSASSKAAGLGSSLALLAVATHFGRLEITTRAIAAILFIFMTIPLAAHMVARAGYLIQVAIWQRTGFDELAGQYDPRSLELAGRFPARATQPSQARQDALARESGPSARDQRLDADPQGPEGHQEEKP